MLVALKNSAAFLERSLAVSYKLHHIFTTWASSSTPGHLSLRNKNLCSQNLCTHMHGNCLCNSQTPEAPQASFTGERLLAPGQPHHGNNSAMTKTMLPTPATTWMSLQHITVSERGQFQEVTHCMVPFTAMWLSQAGKALIMENGSWLLGWGRRGRCSYKG